MTPSSWIPSFFLDLLLLALSVLFDPADRSFRDFHLCYSCNSANCFSCLFSFPTIPQLSSFVSSCLCVFSSLQLCSSFILLISILTSFTFCSYFSSPNLSHFSETEFFQIILWSQRDLSWNNSLHQGLWVNFFFLNCSSFLHQDHITFQYKSTFNFKTWKKNPNFIFIPLISLTTSRKVHACIW